MPGVLAIQRMNVSIQERNIHEAGFFRIQCFVCINAGDSMSAAALSFMRTSSFLTRLAIAREAKEYQYWAAYGLMNYAIAAIQTSPSIPIQPIIFEQWPTVQSPYQGLIQATVADDQVTITVQLTGGKTVHEQLTRVIPLPIHLSA